VVARVSIVGPLGVVTIVSILGPPDLSHAKEFSGGFGEI